MTRKKKLIWWELDAGPAGADEARRRGVREGSGRRALPDAYLGPVTLGDPDRTAGPAAVGAQGG